MVNESAPSLRSLSGKILDVQGRNIVQSFIECTALRVHWDTGSTGQYCRLLLQDFWTEGARDYLALIDSIGNFRLYDRVHWCT